MRRMLSACLLVVLSACKGIPSSPAPPIPPPSTAPAATRFVTVGLVPATLPAGGGIAKVMIHTAANESNTIVAPHARVTLHATAGALKDAELTTNSAGYAETEWTSTQNGEVLVSVGEVVGRATVSVAGSPTGTPGPTPGPPSPTPPTPNPPTPAPAPPAPTPPQPNPPLPAGDLVLAITANPTSPFAGESVDFAATVSSTTGAPVPLIVSYAWDLDNNRAPDQRHPTPSHTYTTAGVYTVPLEVRTADNRAVTGALMLTVREAPGVTVTLDATPSAAGLGDTVTLVATATPNSTSGAITTYEWDFDTSAPSVDQTTAGNSTTTSYSTIGTKTIRVRAISASGATATATRTMTVSAPELVVGLNISGTQTIGSTITITATLSSTGPIPGSMTFAWDYTNDGTFDEVTTGPSPRPVNHVFNQAGTYTVRVRMTSPDGRTATNTVTLTIS